MLVELRTLIAAGPAVSCRARNQVRSGKRDRIETGQQTLGQREELIQLVKAAWLVVTSMEASGGSGWTGGGQGSAWKSAQPN